MQVKKSVFSSLSFCLSFAKVLLVSQILATHRVEIMFFLFDLYAQMSIFGQETLSLHPKAQRNEPQQAYREDGTETDGHGSDERTAHAKP